MTVPEDIVSKVNRSSSVTVKQFDLISALLASSGIAMITVSLTLAGLASHGWRIPHILVLLILGLLVLALFVFRQGRSEHPLMPLKIWADKNFSLLVTILSLCFCGFAGNLLWLCLLWQRVENNTPLLVDAKLLPAAISGVCTEIIVGLTMHLIKNEMFLLLGTIAFVASNALLSSVSERVTYWALMFPALVLMTVGAGLLFTVTNVYVLSHLPGRTSVYREQYSDHYVSLLRNNRTGYPDKYFHGIRRYSIRGGLSKISSLSNYILGVISCISTCPVATTFRQNWSSGSRDSVRHQ